MFIASLPSSAANYARPGALLEQFLFLTLSLLIQAWIIKHP